MPAPPRHRRAKDFKPGRIAGWPVARPDQTSVAHRVSYVADAKHKDHPAPNGEWQLGGNSDGEKCPLIPPEIWPKIQEALREAVAAGVVDERFRGVFPARLWVYVNDTLHEARLSNQETGEYHGFPLDYRQNHPMDPHDLLRLAPRIRI